MTRKRIVSAVLILLLLCGNLVVPARAAKPKAKPPLAMRNARVAELDQWLCGTYFNVNQKKETCGKKTADDSHGCSSCDTVNIIKQDWFKKHFSNTLKVSQFISSGQSCNGFAWFACWYINRASDKDTTWRDKNETVQYNLNKSTKAKDIAAFRGKVEARAEVGDFLNFNGGHFGVYLGCNDDGVYILDCNGDNAYRCYVQKHTMPWNRISYIKISKIYSSTGGFCSHDSQYTTWGICGTCGAILPNKDNNYPVTVGDYKLKVSSYNVHTAPYMKSSSVATLKKGDVVRVDKAVKNGLDSIWYHVIFDKKEGYIYEDNLALKTAIGSISADQPKAPGSIYVGSEYNISGTIKVSGTTITGVRAYFCNAGGTSAVSGTATSLDKVNTTTYSLYKSNVDKQLKFSKLSAGSYRCCVEVSTSNPVDYNGATTNTVKLYSANFTAAPKPPEVKAPVISQVFAYPGGVRYQIVQSTDNATLYYYTNAIGKQSHGAYLSTGSKQVVVDLEADDEIRAYSERGGVKAAAQNVVVHLPVLNPPDILAQQTSTGVAVTIAGDSGAKLYYTLDHGTVQTYTGTFILNANHEITAYAEKDGCVTSDFSTCTVTVAPPATPSIRLRTASDIPAGGTISVSWQEDPAVQYYQLSVLRDGTTVRLENQITANGYSYETTEPGVYTIRMCAVNQIGRSEDTEISATAHAPSTVTFLNWDESVWLEQVVPYGQSASRPTSSPTRRGYSFDGWDGSYSNVTSDQTVRAVFRINTYSVRFFDVDGRLLGTQQIPFDQAIDSAAMESLVHTANGGMAFSGWYIEYAAEDSMLDLEHIDSDMRLRAVTGWRSQELPVFVEGLSVSVSKSSNGVFNGYIVTGQISSSDENDLKLKLLVTLQTKAEDDSYKMIAASVVPVALDAGASARLIDGVLSDGILVSTDGKSRADRAEITVLSIEGDDRTGGLLAPIAAVDIPTSVFADVFWSDWFTLDELTAQGYTPSDPDVEAKTEYRDRVNTKTTITTSSPTPPEGYEFGADKSYWGSWSDWSSNYVSSSSSRQVETRRIKVTDGHTEYRYGTWYGSGYVWCCNCDSSLHKTYSEKYTSWSTSRVTPKSSKITCGYVYTSSHPHKYYAGQLNSGGYNSSSHKDFWYQYEIGDMTYFWEQSRWVEATYRTEYRYRDYVPCYEHYTWNPGKWSDWTEDVLTDPNPTDRSYEVESRVLYRYKNYSSADIPTNTDGETYTVSGKLAVPDTAGKLVTILVYKSRNTDPTASQLEYVGQTAADADGSYTLSFRTKEMPTSDTGDFVVAIAVEGGTGLLNVDLIPYERPTYTVTFVSDEGEVLSTVQVTEGEDAPIPEAPQRAGYIFCGWDGRSTNIRSDSVLTAKFYALPHAAVFADHLNGTCVLLSVRTGESLDAPEAPSAEGHTFNGWDGYTPGMTITEDTVFTANWTPETYRVVFHNDRGDALMIQNVEYGKAASLPMDLAVSDELEFLGWSNDACWWFVTEDIDVFPIIAYKQTTAAPASNLGSYIEGLEETLYLTAEPEAEIYYTLDGSTPDPLHADETGSEGTYRYTAAGIPLNETTLVSAVAEAPEKNVSACVPISFIRRSETEPDPDYELEPVANFNIPLSGESVIELDFRILNNPGLQGLALFVNADPSILGILCDPETQEPILEIGDAAAGNGSFIVDNYDPEYGWRIVWSGEQASKKDGELLKLSLHTDNEIVNESCPISVSYARNLTYTEEQDSVYLEQKLKVGITVIKDGTQPVTNPFSDVAEGKYYYEPVLWAVNHDPVITNGTDDTHFSPNKTCTRGQVVTFLWRAYGCPEPATTSHPFTDVKNGAYYYTAMLWAVEQGITSGTSATTFGPNKDCTRAQVVTFLWRAAGEPEPEAADCPFTDVKTGSSYYKAVLWAVENGVTSGTSASTFSPGKICTRGQVVTFLYNALAK